MTTVEAAATGYLAFVGPMNARLEEIGVRADVARSLDEMRRISEDYARLHDEYAAGLRLLDVPDDLLDELVAAAEAAEQVAAVERAAARARRSDFRATGRALADALDEQRRRINVLRDGLGLTPID